MKKIPKNLEGERHRPFLKKEIEIERMREGMHNLSKEQISLLETANAKIQNNLDDTATKMLERVLEPRSTFCKGIILILEPRSRPLGAENKFNAHA